MFRESLMSICSIAAKDESTTNDCNCRIRGCTYGSLSFDLSPTFGRSYCCRTGTELSGNCLMRLNNLAASFATRTHGSFPKSQKRQSTAALQNVPDIPPVFP